MKRASRLWLTSICVICCLLGATHWLQTRPVYAYQIGPVYNDGEFYISATADVDSSYELYVDSFMAVEFDYYEDIDYIALAAYADEDGGVFANGIGYGDDYDSVDLNGSYGPVPTGHEYGMESDGYACFDDGDGDDGEDDGIVTSTILVRRINLSTSWRRLR